MGFKGLFPLVFLPFIITLVIEHLYKIGTDCFYDTWRNTEFQVIFSGCRGRSPLFPCLTRQLFLFFSFILVAFPKLQMTHEPM